VTLQKQLARLIPRSELTHVSAEIRADYHQTIEQVGNLRHFGNCADGSRGDDCCRQHDWLIVHDVEFQTPSRARTAMIAPAAMTGPTPPASSPAQLRQYVRAKGADELLLIPPDIVQVE
jgi:hypothetical protein